MAVFKREQTAYDPQMKLTLKVEEVSLPKKGVGLGSNLLGNDLPSDLP